MIYRLEKPPLMAAEVEIAAALLKIAGPEHAFAKFIRQASLGQDYLYWDKLRYKEPTPFDKELTWALVKQQRKLNQIESVIRDRGGKLFSWSKLDYFDELLHELDLNTGGELFVDKGKYDKINKQKLIARGIMEEAIASSQLEGAATSRKIAKKMLQEDRKPKNHSEQMIVNNYNSMKAIEERYKDEKMSMDFILELHGMIVKDVVDSENQSPRLRDDGEPVYIADSARGIIYYEAPSSTFVKKELKRLIAFANDELGVNEFIHPVVKAIMLHFWIGYLHPFTDGNGRLARLIFYWYLLRKGYWAFAYLPISAVIKRSSKSYIMAYVYSEQDDYDLNYFINFNLKKIKEALKDFNVYLEKQASKNVVMKRKGEIKYDLNVRQICLLQYIYGSPDERVTLKSHMSVNQITKMTAHKDLKGLVQAGFLETKKQGRNVYYFGTKKIKELF